MNLRYKLTYDLFVDYGCAGGLEFISTCRNADSLDRINQIADELKAQDRRNRNFLIVDTQEESAAIEWNRLTQSPEEKQEMSTAKQFQVWFEDISGGQPSVVATYDNLDGALRQMYSFYLERASTYTMSPRLKVSEPNLMQFQEFHFRNDVGDFGGIFWIVFPGASPQDRYPVDEYGYHILPGNGCPSDTFLTPEEVKVEIVQEIEVTLNRLKYKLEYFGDEIGSSEYHNLLMEVGRLEEKWNLLTLSPEEESAAIEWNRTNPVMPMDWGKLMASEPAIAELFKPDEDRHITLQEGIDWLTRLGCTDIDAGRHIIDFTASDGHRSRIDIREYAISTILGDEDRHITLDEGIDWLAAIGGTDIVVSGIHFLEVTMDEGYRVTVDIREHFASIILGTREEMIG